MQLESQETRNDVVNQAVGLLVMCPMLTPLPIVESHGYEGSIMSCLVPLRNYLTTRKINV
jgi:hypothetical protein